MAPSERRKKEDDSLSHLTYKQLLDRRDTLEKYPNGRDSLLDVELAIDRVEKELYGE